MKNILEVKELSKSYPQFSLKNINFNIEEGTIMGLIGENGAGKTTIIKAILNLINKDSGEISIFNKDNIKEEKIIKEDIGVVLGESFFSPMVDAKDISNIMKLLHKKWDEKLFEKYLLKFQLPKDKKIKDLSKGMLMKLEIATALSHNPKLLILDEPTSGLDPIVRKEILDIFLDFIQDETKSILLSTHITSDLERIADNITFINNGQIVLKEKTNVLIENYGIIKCDDKTFNNIEKDDIIRYKKNKYNYEILIKNKREIINKYKNIIIDKPSIEDIMYIYIKGEI